MATPADIANKVSPLYTVEVERRIEAERLLREHALANEAKAEKVDAFKTRMGKKKYKQSKFFDKVVKPIWLAVYEAYFMGEDRKRAKALGLTLEEAYALYLPHKLSPKKRTKK